LSEKEYEFKIIDVNRMKFKKYTDEERLENFSKLWADDKDLHTIVNAYLNYIDMPLNVAMRVAINASQKHKDKKLFKKKFLKYIKPSRLFKRDTEELKQSINHISVVIMAKNAEETLARSLDSLMLFDEVLLYLNDSTDSTRSIAEQYPNVKIVEGEFLGFGATKNAAGSHSKHDWILSLDSDEILNEDIINEISQLDFTSIKNVYKLKRDNYFLGRETQNSNMIVRMYNKHYTKFDNSVVHEKIIVPKDAHLMTLKYSFTHLYILNINQTLRKIIHYTDLGSEGKKTCYFTVVVAKTFFAFFKTYILQGNVIKGWVGYALAVNSANKRHYKYLKQFLNCQEEKKKKR
jgi:glycosyltransferase involved in cell wall biosynthesis